MGQHFDIDQAPGMTSMKTKKKLECAASNGNRYPPYPQVMATAISQQWLPPSFAPTLTLEKKMEKKSKKKKKTQMV